jgi:hypothetical protein
MQKTIQTITRYGAIFFYLIFLAGCAGTKTPITPPITETATEILPTSVVSIPTQVQEPTTAIDAPTQASEINNLTPIVIEQPTLQPTQGANSLTYNVKIPTALLQVEKPGEMSRLSSPFLVTANVYPGDQGMVNVQLFGEDGRLMADQLLQLTQSESGWVSLATEIKFESISAGESAIVVLSTRDAFGRRIAQVGMPVILLQIGNSEVETVKFSKQPVILTLPVAGGFARKGNLHIEGLVHLFNDNPVILELVTQTGGIAANKAVYLQFKDGEEFTPFALDLPYSVSKRTPVRLTIRQASTLSSSVDISLYSQLIFLDP